MAHQIWSLLIIDRKYQYYLLYQCNNVLFGMVVLFWFQVAFLDIGVDRIYEEWLYLEPMCINASGQVFPTQEACCLKTQHTPVGFRLNKMKPLVLLAYTYPGIKICVEEYQMKAIPSYTWPLEHVLLQGFTTIHLCLSEYRSVLLKDMMFSIPK